MMAIEAVSYLPPSQPVTLEGDVTAAKGGADFSAWLSQQVDVLNRQLIDSDNQLRGLAVGEIENLHQVMMSLEKAKLSFELALQVRNKLLEAYQDIMRMQI
jgi:flagellar hook-basal body complex protein FliE